MFKSAQDLYTVLVRAYRILTRTYTIRTRGPSISGDEIWDFSGGPAGLPAPFLRMTFGIFRRPCGAIRSIVEDEIWHFSAALRGHPLHC